MTTIEDLTRRALEGDPDSLQELRNRGLLDSAKAASHEKTAVYPLSHAQKRLWFQCRFQGASAAYNMPAAFQLDGNLDENAFTAAFEKIVQRHESLRTVFVLEDTEPLQHIRAKSDFKVVVQDLTGSEDPPADALETARRAALEPFDLSAGPLIRVSLLRIAISTVDPMKNRYMMLFNMHHIVSDGWSIDVLIREFVEFYHAFRENRDPSPAPLRIHYKDYAAWQAKQSAGEGVNRHRDYWIEKLSGDIPILDLPADFPRPPVQTFSGNTIGAEFNETETENIMRLARDFGTTLFITLTAAVKVLLHRYTGKQDIIVGSPVAGREHPDLEDQIGFYVNTLALRDVIDATKPFADVLNQVRRTVTEAYDHQAYPFDRLVEELNLRRDLARSPLFDVVTALHGSPPSFALDSVSVTPVEIEFPSAKFDITFHFSLHNGRLSLDTEYRTDLFCEERIRNMALHLQTLFQSIVEDPERPVYALSILPEQERTLILDVFNDTAAAYPSDSTITGLFESVAKRFPDRTAVIYEDKTTDYRKLNRIADAIAGAVRSVCNPAPDERIAVILGRTEYTPAALIGVLKSGGAYVPVDPAYPEERIRYILEDGGCRAVVTETEFVALVKGLNPIGGADLPIIDVRALNPAEDSKPPSAREPVHPDHAAYVIYTSGSTGLPKGCVVTHRNVVRLMMNDRLDFTFSPDDAWIAAHSFCFDFSVWEMYGALLYGGRLVIAKSEETRDPEALLDLIRKHRATVLNQTPAAFYNLIDAELKQPEHRLDSHLRYVIFGGDKLNPAYLKPWADLYSPERIELINMYGITETTVHVSFGPLKRRDIDGASGVSPIGSPLPETRVYVCDRWMNLQPVGIPGELYVAGSGVSRGYLNREELTREKFLADPFRPGERMYRTGDVGRWMYDGTMEFFGRNDHQIQIRGFRVEPGEIETCLASHPDVEKAVATVIQGRHETLELVAYIVGRNVGADPVNLNTLRNHLKQRLPDYMIPNHIIQLDRFPLTSNNKIDRKALPEPEGVRPELESRYAAPATEIETRITDIWRDVLKLDRAGVHDNFFDLGGHSLSMIQVRSRLNETLGKNLTVVELFKYPTIRSLADYISESGSGDTRSSGRERAFKRESRKDSVKNRKASRLKRRNK